MSARFPRFKHEVYLVCADENIKLREFGSEGMDIEAIRESINEMPKPGIGKAVLVISRRQPITTKQPTND